MVSVSKSTVIGIVINLLVTAVLVYFLYANNCGFFPGPEKQNSMSAPQFKVAFIEMEPNDSTALVQKGILEKLIKADGSSLAELVVLDANNDKIRLQALIEKAIEDRMDVLIPFGTLCTQLTKEIVTKRSVGTPIVFAGIGDPVKTGIILEPGTPTEHITGFGVFGFDFVEPMVDQLPLLAPHVKRILIPYNPTSLGGTLEEYRQYIGNMLKSRGYKVSDIKIFHSNEVNAKLQSCIADTDLVWILPDATMFEAMDGIAKLCVQHQKCSYVTMNLNQLNHGAALAFGYSLYEVGLDVGDYLVRILQHGEKIADLPVVSVTKTRLKVGMNVQNAHDQGLLKHIEPAVVYIMEHGMVFKDAV